MEEIIGEDAETTIVVNVTKIKPHKILIKAPAQTKIKARDKPKDRHLERVLDIIQIHHIAVAIYISPEERTLGTAKSHFHAHGKTE